jgi:hypothetical protein
MIQKNQKLKEENLDLQKKKEGNSYQTNEGSWGSLEGVFGQRLPLFLVRTCKNQQAKACWKCCKIHTNVKKNSVFTQKSFHK